MSLYDAKSTTDFYKIIKPCYIQNQRQFYNSAPQLTTIQSHDKRLQIVRQKVNATGALDFSFVSSYLQRCKYYYHIQYHILQFFVISVKPLTAREKNKIYNTVIRLYTVTQLYNMQKPMNIYLMMNPMKRYLSKNAPINTHHINGGFTYINGNNIFIIRKEEYEKVLIHELLHHNTHIHYDYYKNENINKLKSVFNIAQHCNLYPNEAIVETFACIINATFYAIDREKDIQHFKRLLKQDCQHSLVICNKIIDKQKNDKWYEKTNAYSYCVLKTILYTNFNKFIKEFQYINDTHITDFICKNYKRVFNIAKRHKNTNKSMKLTIF